MIRNKFKFIIRMYIYNILILICLFIMADSSGCGSKSHLLELASANVSGMKAMKVKVNNAKQSAGIIDQGKYSEIMSLIDESVAKISRAKVIINELADLPHISNENVAKFATMLQQFDFVKMTELVERMENLTFPIRKK